MVAALGLNGSTVDLLDAQVRDVVRRQAVDPLLDRAAVRRIAEQVVADHDRHSLTGAVSPIDDQTAVLEELLARVAGFGPLQRYLDDPTVEEIWINGPAQVFVARHGQAELTTTILTEVQVRDLVEQMLKTSGRRLDLSKP